MPPLAVKLRALHISRVCNRESGMIGSLISFLIIGLIAGWAAGKLTTGSGFGLVGNLVVGVVGAFVGGVIFWVLGLTAHNLIGQIVTAVFGAIIALFIAAKLKNKSA
jgi:uncharacterized membrane protein YeaQ/YmgE (transglycosylase-associated protein family)